LKGKIPSDLIDILPSGFQGIDFVAIINLKEELHPYSKIIGETIMMMIPNIKSVWIRKGKITGKFRKPSGLEYICGKEITEVEHHENKIKYKFDFTKIMFAKGNITERRLLPSLVQDNETIVDMFAGIGYFSLGIGKHAKVSKIYSIELNPESYKYLEINITLNKLDEIIKPIHGDCKIKSFELSKQGIIADRIIMGVFPAPFDYLESACSIIKRNPLTIRTDKEKFYQKAEEQSKFDVYKEIKPPFTNTIIHFEGVSMGRKINEIFEKFSEIMQEFGFESSLLAFRFVKSYGPKMWHTVLDIAVGL
jgi:tRNA wybutosine-synthesizing protein 2